MGSIREDPGWNWRDRGRKVFPTTQQDVSFSCSLLRWKRNGRDWLPLQLFFAIFVSLMALTRKMREGKIHRSLKWCDEGVTWLLSGSFSKRCRRNEKGSEESKRIFKSSVEIVEEERLESRLFSFRSFVTIHCAK